MYLVGKKAKKPKPRKGPPPEVLRKSGAHKDKKRKTGREPVRGEDFNSDSSPTSDD